MSNFSESPEEISQATNKFVMQQTMLRIKDPKVSLAFYENVLGMKLLGKYDFPSMQFTLYFLGYEQDVPEGDAKEKAQWVFGRSGLIELTHNWGTETDENFTGYHSGKYDVEFVKNPDDGSMKGLAFIKDPDGYWIEVLSAEGITDIILSQ